MYSSVLLEMYRRAVTNQTRPRLLNKPHIGDPRASEGRDGKDVSVQLHSLSVLYRYVPTGKENVILRLFFARMKRKLV